MFIDPCLELFIILVKQVQGLVDIIEGKTVEVLKIDFLIMESVHLGGRIEDAGEDQQAEDSLQVILDGSFFLDALPELIEFQLLVELLEHGITDILKVVLIRIHGGGKVYVEGSRPGSPFFLGALLCGLFKM